MSQRKKELPYHALLETCNYESMSYWDARYKEFDQTFEWYCSYSQIKHIISEYCPKNGKTIILGAGNSTMSHEMSTDGHTQIQNVDFSRVVIDQMSTLHKNDDDVSNGKNTTITWTQTDCIDMPFPDEEFDCAIDKATFDCLFCDDADEGWNAAGGGTTAKVTAYCREVDRVLTPEGYYIIISAVPPETALRCLEVDDDASDEFVTFECCRVVAVPDEMSLLHQQRDRERKYGFGGGEGGFVESVIDLSNGWNVGVNCYFVYVCRRDPVKVEKRRWKVNRQFVKREGRDAFKRDLGLAKGIEEKNRLLEAFEEEQQR